MNAALVDRDNKNLEILPKWHPPGALTMPFVDEHVAVRFLGGVNNYSDATLPGCADSSTVWCDLVRRLPDGSLESRFDLVKSRLDRYALNGLDVMIVLDNVPWAFVSVKEQVCAGFGCQYLPPDDPQEFADWIGELATYLGQTYGSEYAARIRWRLGTEANGPRWGNRGQYFQRYLDAYKLTAERIRAKIPRARVGASNWVEVMGKSGDLTPGGSDDFQYRFYAALAEDPSVPLDWISISHYGGGHEGSDTSAQNFPGADYVQRTPFGDSGAFELQAMKELAKRPDAALEVQEWGILNNEAGQSTNEPSSVGTAWSAASAATWMCHGVDRIFHWATGATLRNRTGDGRLVQFYEQWSWNLAILELFIGGRGRFATYDLPQAGSVLNHSVAVIESVKDDAYYALVAAVASNRSNLFSTTVSLAADALGTGDVVVEQYQMNSERSVVETVIRELTGQPGMFQEPGQTLPADFKKLLTPQGLKYVQQPENLDRYWQMNADAFKLMPFEGTWSRDNRGRLHLHAEVYAFSVTVFVARPATVAVSV